jgi:hypothetical protein
MKLTGENWSIGEKTCHSATLSTTNPTWIDPGFFFNKMFYLFNHHFDLQLLYSKLQIHHFTLSAVLSNHLLSPFTISQDPFNVNRDRTRASAVRGRRLTAWAMARPWFILCFPPALMYRNMRFRGFTLYWPCILLQLKIYFIVPT